MTIRPPSPTVNVESGNGRELNADSGGRGTTSGVSEFNWEIV